MTIIRVCLEHCEPNIIKCGYKIAECGNILAFVYIVHSKCFDMILTCLVMGLSNLVPMLDNSQLFLDFGFYLLL